MSSQWHEVTQSKKLVEKCKLIEEDKKRNNLGFSDQNRDQPEEKFSPLRIKQNTNQDINDLARSAQDGLEYATRYMHPDYKEKLEEKRERELRLNSEVNENMR